jgi:hypothetical protein
MGPFTTADTSQCNECPGFGQPTEHLDYGSNQDGQWYSNAYGAISANEQQIPTASQQVTCR